MTSKLNLLSFDKYDIEAVIAPATLSLLLIIIAASPLIDFDSVKELFNELPSALISVVAILVVFVIWRQIVRIVSKRIIEPVLFGKDCSRLPTTLYLLRKESYGNNLIADKVRKKVKKDFDITLKSLSQEYQNPLQAYSAISSAVRLIIKEVQKNAPEMYTSKNIRYGLCRNMVGGCCIAFIFNAILVSIAYFNSCPLLLGSIFLVLSGLIGVFFYFNCKSTAKDYANELFETYLTLK